MNGGNSRSCMKPNDEHQACSRHLQNSFPLSSLAPSLPSLSNPPCSLALPLSHFQLHCMRSDFHLCPHWCRTIMFMIVYFSVAFQVCVKSCSSHCSFCPCRQLGNSSAFTAKWVWTFAIHKINSMKIHPIRFGSFTKLPWPFSWLLESHF